MVMVDKGIGKAIREVLDAGGEPDPDKIADKLGVGTNSVRARIVEIRKTRALQLARLSKSPKGPKDPARLAPTSASLLPLEELNALTPEGRMERLRTLAETGTEQVQLAALKFLDELHKSTGASLGPPPPLDSPTRVSRVVRILTAVTPQEAHEAWNLAAIPLPEPNSSTPPATKSDSSLSAPPSPTAESPTPPSVSVGPVDGSTPTPASSPNS